MRVRRIVCIAIGVAMSATVGLASAQASTNPQPVSEAAPRLLLVDAAITPVVGRAGPSWADGHAEERRPASRLFGVLAETPRLHELAWVGVVLAALVGTCQCRSVVFRVRGPPVPDLV